LFCSPHLCAIINRRGDKPKLQYSFFFVSFIFGDYPNLFCLSQIPSLWLHHGPHNFSRLVKRALHHVPSLIADHFQRAVSAKYFFSVFRFWTNIKKKSIALIVAYCSVFSELYTNMIMYSVLGHRSCESHPTCWAFNRFYIDGIK
jgi:hypothetical protein